MTYANQIANRHSRPVLVVIIDGIGNRTLGSFKFCTKIPAYGTAPTYKPYIKDWPSMLSESIPATGGIAESGELTIELLDVDDTLTDQFGYDVQPFDALTAALTAAQTTISITDTSLTSTDVVYVGSEAIAISSHTGGGTYNVVRGGLGTSATTHDSGAAVFLNQTPFVIGRRMRLYLTFDDAGHDTTEEANGEIGGGWFVDSIAMGEGLNSWIISGRSQAKMLDRLLFRRQHRSVIDYMFDPTIVWGLTQNPWQIHFDDGDDRLFFKVEDQIIRCANDRSEPSEQIILDKRGVGGTYATQLRPGDSIKQVFLADPEDDFGSFRYQDPGDEDEVRDGDWTPSAHPVIILLNLLTSSSTGDDDLSNYTSNKGNYSALPPRVGLGIPAAEIDFDSFLDIYQRFAHHSLPYLTLEGSEVARKWIQENILGVTGYMIKTANGQLSCDFFRFPTTLDTPTEWGDDDILVEEDSNGHRVPMLNARLSTDHTTSSVRFTIRGPRGEDIEETYSDADFPRYFGNQDGYYQSGDKPIDINARSVRNAGVDVLRHRAIQLLYRFRKPLWEIDCVTDLSHAAVEIGDLIALTHSQLPNPTAGTRGWTSVICKVVSKEIQISPDFVGIHWRLLAYGSAVKIGVIAPSAMISSVATNTATVAANRYTDPNSATLPATDAAGFTVDDHVRLVDRSGDPISTTPSFQTISSISSNDITLDGNFGGSGSFAAGTVLEYVNADDADSQQTNSYVFMADGGDIGSTFAGTPWRYGEP